MSKKIGMIALGCAKNRVDAEVLLGMLEKHGYEICPDLAECDACIVHTCTFIGPAKEESIGAILDAAEYKTKGKLKKIIVTGCMAERYRGEIIENMPEVDACLGSKSFDKIVEAIESDGIYEYYAPLDTPCPDGERVLTSTDYSVYVKIADGCSNHCTYCVIPSVRGEFQPRPFEDVLDEIRTLAFNGAKEINLIAQDTTKYPRLCELIKKTCAIPSVKWVRVLYCRPEGITDEFLELMANEEKFCSYIDVPLQHASKDVLKRMNRSGDVKSLAAQMQHIRDMVPGVSLRTTFISGFPHESEADFEELCEFVSEVRFNNLGVFPYSREEGTPAARMRGQIGEQTKQDRADRIMQMLAFNGAKEINLIAQDTTKYPRLCELIKKTCAIPSVKWVRVLYCRPEGITDEFLELMANEEKFCSYIDVPLQHASKDVLKRMNRSGDVKSLAAQMQHIRDMVPGVSLRTTFISGFPHESEADFEELCEFVSEVRFNNLGVFPYSREEGTPAARMRGQIGEQTKQDRADRIMQMQLRLLEDINKQYVGKTYDVLVEGAEDGKLVGRSYFQAPDIDGRVYFDSDFAVSEGDFVRVRIDECKDYDLFGKAVKK